jgi:hypothetical protein
MLKQAFVFARVFAAPPLKTTEDRRDNKGAVRDVALDVRKSCAMPAFAYMLKFIGVRVKVDPCTRVTHLQENLRPRDLPREKRLQHLATPIGIRFSVTAVVSEAPTEQVGELVVDAGDLRAQAVLVEIATTTPQVARR